MKIAYFDTISGISGDMTLGAFVSAGIRIDDLSAELKKLNVSGFELAARHIERSGMTATKVDVIISEEPKYHRHLKDIYGIIDASALSTKVKETAKKIFHEVGVAEAHVHNSTIDKIHFHEVGALDSLVDIVGAAVCLEKFSIDAVYSSPIRVGRGGFVKTRHGLMPTPTPATMEILKGYPTVLTDIEAELTTPTGAAIIKALSRGVLSSEQVTVQSIGYGAGTTELAQVPNLLRVMVGELLPRYENDEVVSVETNIDDMNPEIHPYVVEQLLAAGAHDAFLIPILMKKGRPGILLSTLVERSKLDRILAVIFRETSTLGVRIQPVERKKIPRSVKEINSSLGLVKVKVIIRDGKETLAPEFEECKRLAEEKNLPLKDVYGILQKELE
ncbi:MAG: nickel pincer cofactor biosynthesis protein LarC [Bacteroidota bacterium]